MKILYLTGWGRSGSTILCNILNEIEGVFHTGELKYVWENGLLKKRPCGCGEPVKACGVWSGVFERAYGAVEQSHPRLAIRQCAEAPKNRAVLKELVGLKTIQWKAHRAYLNKLARLYRAIQAVTGCSVVLDSSKAPAYGYLLGQLSHVDVYYLHLVRDARATAFSWQRKVQRQDVKRNEEMEQRTLPENAKRWILCNTISELVGRQRSNPYVRVRYEDFVRDPIHMVKTVLRFAGVGAVKQLPFTDSHSVQLGPNHTVWGNPSRTTRGVVRIRKDDAWRTNMEPPARWATNALTWPLLLKYGYEVL
jgi:hypothetical protein